MLLTSLYVRYDSIIFKIILWNVVKLLISLLLGVQYSDK